MKICLYSPYVPNHFGGGEKYMFDVARMLDEMGHEVFFAIDEHLPASQYSEFKKKYEEFLDCSLDKVKFLPTPIGTSAGFLRKLWWTKNFDVMYYATDGSLFLSLAKKNIVHIQIPFTQKKTSFIERLKLANWQIKNANSVFTKNVVENAWQTKIQYVHYPMVAEPVDLKGEKEKIILSVGRFFRQLHSKKQDVLVKFFQKMVHDFPTEMKKWQLVLIGSVEDESYAAEIAAQAKDLPIKIIHDINREELLKWYARSSIYWHATGYQVDEKTHPEMMEHFGISTVEAMSYGDVPVVIGKGGQVEVVGDELSSWLWWTEDECIEKTLSLIKEPSAISNFAHLAKRQSQKFSPTVFQNTLEKMIQA